MITLVLHLRQAEERQYQNIVSDITHLERQQKDRVSCSVASPCDVPLHMYLCTAWHRGTHFLHSFGGLVCLCLGPPPPLLLLLLLLFH